MQRIVPPDSAGLSRFDASIAPPLVAPAPITVWISSMNRIACGQLLELVDDRLQPLLEIAAIARAGEQRAHVERIDHRGQQHLGHVALDDLARQAFGDRGLADAGIADIERVVLRAAAQDLDRAIDLGAAADQRIDLAVLRLLVEIDGELLERAFALALALGSWRLSPPRRPSLRAAPAAAPPLPTPWLMKLTASRRLMSCCCRK